MERSKRRSTYQPTLRVVDHLVGGAMEGDCARSADWLGYTRRPAITMSIGLRRRSRSWGAAEEWRTHLRASVTWCRELSRTTYGRWGREGGPSQQLERLPSGFGVVAGRERSGIGSWPTDQEPPTWRHALVSAENIRRIKISLCLQIPSHEPAAPACRLPGGSWERSAHRPCYRRTDN